MKLNPFSHALALSSYFETILERCTYSVPSDVINPKKAISFAWLSYTNMFDQGMYQMP